MTKFEEERWEEFKEMEEAIDQLRNRAEEAEAQRDDTRDNVAILSLKLGLESERLKAEAEARQANDRVFQERIEHLKKNDEQWRIGAKFHEDEIKRISEDNARLRKDVAKLTETSEWALRQKAKLEGEIKELKEPQRRWEGSLQNTATGDLRGDLSTEACQHEWVPTWDADNSQSMKCSKCGISNWEYTRLNTKVTINREPDQLDKAL